jgi:hypothetical protein
MQPHASYKYRMDLGRPHPHEDAADVGGTPPRHRGSRYLLGRAVSSALVPVAIGAFATACDSGSASPGVASVGSTATTTTQAPATQAGSTSVNYADAVAYAHCTRTHGVTNYPDPTSSSAFIHVNGKLNGQSVDLSSPQATAADKACSHLLLNSGALTPTEQQQALAQGVEQRDEAERLTSTMAGARWCAEVSAICGASLSFSRR